jgi:hypothetical protein
VASFFKNLIDRISAEETKLGKFLKGLCTYVLTGLAACTAIIENINVIPDGFIDPKLKLYLGYAAAASFILGKLTKKSS